VKGIELRKNQNQSGFPGARDSERQWHQLGHMQICNSPQKTQRNNFEEYMKDGNINTGVAIEMSGGREKWRKIIQFHHQHN